MLKRAAVRVWSYVLIIEQYEQHVWEVISIIEQYIFRVSEALKSSNFVSGKIYMRMKEQCMYVDAYVKICMRNFGATHICGREKLSYADLMAHLATDAYAKSPHKVAEICSHLRKKSKG